jgi:hypothetical protein
MARKNVEKSNQTLYCSFCGKSQHKVKRLIAGPTVYICDECIGLCNDIIAEGIAREEAPDSERLGRDMLLGIANRLHIAAQQMREIEDAGSVIAIHGMAEKIAALREEIRGELAR